MPAAKAAVDSLLAVVRPAEKLNYAHGGMHWMGREATPQVFSALASAIHAPPESEAGRILAELEMSAHLYDLNRRATNGELTGFAANNEREELLKRHFAERYRAAVVRGERLPKVMLKLGQAHLTRGQSPFGPFALGNLVSELATANGTRMVNIITFAHNAVADSTAPNLWTWPDMRPIADATPTSATTLIDLRPLRAFLYGSRLGTVGPDLRRAIYGYDFALVIGGRTPRAERVLSGGELPGGARSADRAAGRAPAQTVPRIDVKSRHSYGWL